MNLPLQVNQLLVVQRFNLGGYQAESLLDRNGIERNRNYLSFPDFTDEALRAVHSHSGLRQLVFVSQSPQFDSVSVAQKIKDLNPAAFVIAFAAHHLTEPDKSQFLDGIIVTSKISAGSAVERSATLAGLVMDIISSFSTGAAPETLSEMISSRVQQ